jgi:hypothetical protein
MPRFADIVENVTSLNPDEMAEIRDIINKILIEKRREEILKDKFESEKLYKEGKLKFYDNSTDFINALNEE